MRSAYVSRWSGFHDPAGFEKSSGRRAEGYECVRFSSVVMLWLRLINTPTELWEGADLPCEPPVDAGERAYGECEEAAEDGEQHDDHRGGVELLDINQYTPALRRGVDLPQRHWHIGWSRSNLHPDRRDWHWLAREVVERAIKTRLGF